jgi:hypothetical protein
MNPGIQVKMSDYGVMKGVVLVRHSHVSSQLTRLELMNDIAFEFVKHLGVEISTGDLKLPAFPDIAIRVKQVLDWSGPPDLTDIVTIANLCANLDQLGDDFNWFGVSAMQRLRLNYDAIEEILKASADEVNSIMQVLSS